LGIDARIVSAQLAAPYRQEGRSGKNDANDAAAVCEAGGRPRMRFVPVKSVEQQSMLCVHKLREGLKEERNACINRIRGLLAEFCLVFPQSPEALRLLLPDALEDASNELASLARLTMQRAAQHWRELDEHIAWCTERIAQHRRDNSDVQRASQLIGIGPITASAAVARSTTSSSSRAARSSPPGWAWCHDSIPAGARTTWAASPSTGKCSLAARFETDTLRRG
jgi:transposase